MEKRKFRKHEIPLIEWKENNAHVREYCCVCHDSFFATVPLFELIGVGYLCNVCGRNLTKKEKKKR